MSTGNGSSATAIKNGKSLEVDIPEEDVVLYVVFDKFFPQRFHSKLVLTAGEDDETLFTYATYSPFTGNPFVLSKNQTMTKQEKRQLHKEVQSNQQSSKSKSLYYLIVIIFIIIGWIIGWNIV